MTFSGQTKLHTGGIAGVLLLLVAIAVLPLAAVVSAADKSEKKNSPSAPMKLEAPDYTKVTGHQPHANLPTTQPKVLWKFTSEEVVSFDGTRKMERTRVLCRW